MLRKVLCAVFTLTVCVGLSAADEIRAVIYGVDDGKVTFAPAKKKGEVGDKVTLPVSKTVKVSKAKFNKETKSLEAGDPLEGGVSNALFTKIGEKGIRALVVTDSDNKNITEIRVFAGKKNKKNDN